MAVALIKGYFGEFDPEQFKDLYQERIRKIINAQLSSAGRDTQLSDAILRRMRAQQAPV